VRPRTRVDKPVSNYPTVIATSVIRSSQQGESHGGVYLVDLNSGTYRNVVDWDDENISWEGRGGDRGLRGIAFHDGLIYLAASDEIFVYDRDFDRVGSIVNNYLRDCHEIFIYDDILYMTSTRYDSLLLYDIYNDSFICGFCFRLKYLYGSKKFIIETVESIGRKFPNLQIVRKFCEKVKSKMRQLYNRRPRDEGYSFNPNREEGPVPDDTIHINNVHVSEHGVFVSGSHLDRMLRVQGGEVEVVASLPTGTHNARPWAGDRILANDTSQDRIVILRTDGIVTDQFHIPRYKEDCLKENDIPEDHARQSFGRGLCTTDDGYIVGGSSPATISVYRPNGVNPEKTVNLTMDVRNAIHGLEIWPFES